MPAALVQNSALTSVSAGTSGNVVLTVSAGNLLVSMISMPNGSTPQRTFTTSDGINTWANADVGTQATDHDVAQIDYAKNVAGGSTTVTVTASASATFAFMVLEVSGVDTSAPLEAHSNENQTSNVTNHVTAGVGGINCSTGSFVASIGAASSSTALTKGAAYTSLNSGTTAHLMQYQIPGSPLTGETGPWTSSATRRDAGVIASFKVPAAAGGGLLLRRRRMLA